MYLEDIVPLVLLPVITVLLLLIVILLAVIIKKFSQLNVPSFNRNDKIINENAIQYSLCKRCGAKYEKKKKKCPECGLPR